MALTMKENPNIKDLSQVRSGVTVSTLFDDVGTNQTASAETNQILPVKDLFETPKPVEMIKRLAAISSSEDDIVLDFFSGSATTAQAVLQLNHGDGGNRSFIMVQLPEKTGNKEFPTIADIGKERIRRVI